MTMKKTTQNTDIIRDPCTEVLNNRSTVQPLAVHPEWQCDADGCPQVFRYKDLFQLHIKTCHGPAAIKEVSPIAENKFNLNTISTKNKIQNKAPNQKSSKKHPKVIRVPKENKGQIRMKLRHSIESVSQENPIKSNQNPEITLLKETNEITSSVEEKTAIISKFSHTTDTAGTTVNSESATDIKPIICKKSKQGSATTSKKSKVKLVSVTNTINSKSNNNQTETQVKTESQQLIQNRRKRSTLEINKNLPVTCPTCSKVYQNYAKLKAHLRYGHKEKTIQCDLCPKKFNRNYSLKLHQETHFPKVVTDQDYSECNECHKKIRTKCLRVHMKIHTQDYQHWCDQCGKGYPQLSVLKRHVQVVHEGFRYTCMKCQKKFKTEAGYNDHLEFHLTGKRKPAPKQSVKYRKIKKKIVCEFCGKIISTNCSYNDHVRIHTGEKPFVCKYCQKDFHSHTHLKQHLRIHTSEKPYACTICCKRFSQHTTMKIHVRGHTGEKPYECTICKKRFVTHTLLKYHMRTPHNDLELS